MNSLTDEQINEEIAAIKARGDFLDRSELVIRVNALEVELQRRNPPIGKNNSLPA